MTEIRIYDTATLLAEAAAENAVEILNLAIAETGRAVWVLAGGSSPVAAYKILVKAYADAVDWSKVVVLIGDERFVAADHPDSNWGAIMSIFEKDEAFAGLQKIAPVILETPELAADTYEAAISTLGVTTFDLVWLGVGEDGHTLSLFPGNAAFTTPAGRWVVAVENSPKPPSQRISLSLKALENVVELVIFATGAGKKEILKQARLKGGLPISMAAEVAETNGAEVRWLYDDAAWGER